MKKIILILSLLFIGGCSLDLGDPFGPGEGCWFGADEPADPPYGDYTGFEHFIDSTGPGGDPHLPFTFSYDSANDSVFFNGDDNNSFSGVMTSQLVPAYCYSSTNYKFELLITYVSEPDDTLLLNKVVKGIYQTSFTAPKFAIDWSTNSNYPSAYHPDPGNTGYNPDIRDFSFLIPYDDN